MKKHHHKQRGAAMVEGIVVMITMLVFLGMIVFATRAYGGKLDQASETRRDVLYYASHDCAQSLGESSIGTSGESADPGAGTDPSLDRVANAASSTGAAAAVKRSWNTASATKDRTVSGEAVVVTNPESGLTPSRVGMSAQLRTGSWVACNEKRYDNPWTSLFSFGWDFLKSAAGAF